MGRKLDQLRLPLREIFPFRYSRGARLCHTAQRDFQSRGRFSGTIDQFQLSRVQGAEWVGEVFAAGS